LNLRISMEIRSYRDLVVWQKAMTLVEAVYLVTRSFPADERFMLTSQLRRSAVGIPSNISEGHQQGTRAYRRYLRIALGCQAECETQLELARRLRMVADEQLLPVIELAATVGRLLHGLLRKLAEAQSAAPNP